MIIPKHIRHTEKQDYRMIVVSDIHGHLDRFKSLLDKVNYSNDDYLVILGDFVEKGDQVIETIRYVKQLSQNERTFVLLGNCEWAMDALLGVEELAIEIPRYFKRVSSNGCLREVYHLLKLDDGHESLLGAQKKMREYLKDELSFIHSLPVTLSFNDFLFVHAGIEVNKPVKACSLSSLLEMQGFLIQGHSLDKMVIVGHLPTSNYHENCICNDIIIDEKKKIICIDGGTGVKAISQLNALIIESKSGVITYSQEYVRPLPYYYVQCDVYAKKQDIHKIGYPYFEIEVLKKEEYFSYCFQKETQCHLWVKNEFIYERNGHMYCLDDYTDYMFSLKKGTCVQLVGVYDMYSYIVYQNQVGWIKSEYLGINP